MKNQSFLMFFSYYTLRFHISSHQLGTQRTHGTIMQKNLKKQARHLRKEAIGQVEKFWEGK